MRFMLLCCHDEKALDDDGPAKLQAAADEAVQLAHQLDANGQYVLAARLQPVSTATSVRVRQGKRLVTDGPFAETREVLGGFYLIHAKDLDEAIDIAARVPGARLGTVEIRPVLEMPGLPTAS